MSGGVGGVHVSGRGLSKSCQASLSLGGSLGHLLIELLLTERCSEMGPIWAFGYGLILGNEDKSILGCRTGNPASEKK